MLQFLKINNFLLLKNQEIFLNGNFTVVTGETGSGKSMLIKSLRFVLGEKLDNLDLSDSEVSVVAQFELNLDNQILKEILNENGIELKDKVIILRRTLDKANKGKAFVNDVPVTLKLLKKISEELVEFHSQHKQIEAFNSTNCLNIINQFDGNNVLLTKVGDLFQQISKLNEQIDESYKKKQVLEEDQEHIEYSCKEIEVLDLKEGEELELVEKKKLLNDKVKIISAVDSLIALFARDDGVIQKLLKAQRNLSKLEFDVELEEPIEKAIFHLSELQTAAERKLKAFDSNENMEIIEERLSRIKELSRKYRCPSDQLLTIAENYKIKLKNLADIKRYIKEKEIEKEIILKDYFVQAEILSDSRKKAAKELESKILKELKQLKLESVEFKIELTKDILRPIQLKGIDKAKFLIKPNQGFAFAQINEIASGGELSRIMLAFKVVLAEINQKTTIIFDEIDSGTGGAIAQTIGNRMKKLSETNQIIVISHQPQVAAKADQHLLVVKSTDKITQTTINDLNFADKTQEIARMLAGINITDSAVKAALSLIQE